MSTPSRSCDQTDPAREPRPVLQVAPMVIEPRRRHETTRLRDQVLETHARCWLPCDGMSWSSTAGGYPHFAKSARGCRTIDLEGREFVDYLMGWGSALLGYANERIQQAVREALDSAAILTLTHHLMPEVADALCARFESAQAVTFGKNGSDVCTAAVRMARAHTGRRGRPVLRLSRLAGLVRRALRHGRDRRAEKTVRWSSSFAPNNLEELGRLLTLHRGDVAAVMLEPARRHRELRRSDQRCRPGVPHRADRHGASGRARWRSSTRS